jgi:adenosylcobinamide-GDP ribazoletransferase
MSMPSAPGWLRDLSGAWVFYSVLPGWPGVAPGFERIARFAPWIGLVIAALQVAVWLLLQALGWPVAASVLLVISVGVWITGGLHVDGVMDSADGLAAGPSRCLEAMEDSRVGASGVQAFALVLILQVAALWSLADRLPAWIPVVLLSAGFWGRCSPLWALQRFRYLRPDGTAGFHRARARGLREWVPALIVASITLALTFALAQPLGLLIALTMAVGVVISGVVAECLGRRLGGHTGDSYGASVVWTESFTLVALAVLLPLLDVAAG